ncbi:Uncharacterized protein TCM_015282 [Theobroma cacao]|uniref:Uncharacterized protein n=1 Tax=Theobroma cacao TaxID=3641 RepID=A0A061G0J0_THECC|nr:Uncharacterized protein TCM_015282 [Theobroma cacao]
MNNEDNKYPNQKRWSTKETLPQIKKAAACSQQSNQEQSRSRETHPASRTKKGSKKKPASPQPPQQQTATTNTAHRQTHQSNICQGEPLDHEA